MRNPQTSDLNKSGTQKNSRRPMCCAGSLHLSSLAGHHILHFPQMSFQITAGTEAVHSQPSVEFLCDKMLGRTKAIQTRR